MKIVYMFIMTVVAFVISWSPYCAVSIGAMFRKGHVLAHGEAELPELLAKSSVMYNPIIYMSMSKDYRKTLKRTILGCSRSLMWPFATCGNNNNNSNNIPGSSHRRGVFQRGPAKVTC